jgi:predicted Zn-ribbon and HTH transcriptional regulator
MKDKVGHTKASAKDEEGSSVFERLKKLFTKRVKHREPSQPGMITRTCKICGKTFTLPENVQHWPDCCQECRAKYRPVENITRKCRKCGKTFTFPSNAPRWPKYCPECREKRIAGRKRRTSGPLG